MANIYTVDKKHFKYKLITSSDLTEGVFPLDDSLFGQWLKVDTTNQDINLYLPDSVYRGFSCIVENVGENKVNYVTPNNLTLKTDEEPYTDIRYRSVELNFDKENSEWRVQGYIGIDNINAIYDVKTNQDGAPEDGNTLTFDEETGFWKAAPNPLFLTKRDEVITTDFELDNRDHGSFIVIDTKNNPVSVTIPLGLKAGFHIKLYNISNGALSIVPAGNLTGPYLTGGPFSLLEVHHLKDDNYYSVEIGGIPFFGQI